MSMSIISLCLHLGTAVSVSASQTVFANRLPKLLHEYAPGVNVTLVQEAGATNARKLVSPDQLDGFLGAYNQAVTSMFVSGLSSSSPASFIPLAHNSLSLVLSNRSLRSRGCR